VQQVVCNLRNRRFFFRLQVVQVLGGRFARVDLVLDAVDTGHQQGGEEQVGVGRRVAEAGFDTHGFQIAAQDVGNADRGGTVAGRVSQQRGSLEAFHQALVAVGGGVAECV